MNASIRGLVIVFTTFSLVGCTSSYVAPGPGVSPVSIAQGDLSPERAKPVARFPARVAVVRIQGTGYENYSVRGYGSGKFCVVTTREVERDEDITKLSSMNQLAGLARLNRMVLPASFESERDLRQAAARLQADMLLIYTFDTSYRVHDHEIGPLGLITLGTLPNQEARVISTCSAALFDVQTGYIYGLAESTGRHSELASAWRSTNAVDSARQKAEKQAFANMVPELEKMWTQVVAQYGTGPTYSTRIR